MFCLSVVISLGRQADLDTTDLDTRGFGGLQSVDFVRLNGVMVLMPSLPDSTACDKACDKTFASRGID